MEKICRIRRSSLQGCEGAVNLDSGEMISWYNVGQAADFRGVQGVVLHSTIRGGGCFRSIGQRWRGGATLPRHVAGILSAKRTPSQAFQQGPGIGACVDGRPCIRLRPRTGEHHPSFKTQLDCSNSPVLDCKPPDLCPGLGFGQKFVIWAMPSRKCQ